MLEELLHISELFDLYGALLTKKQQRCLTLHLFEDFSLSEIAENMGISRQAVHDMLHRSEQSMEEYEAKLGFLAQRRYIRVELEDIYEKVRLLREREPGAEQIMQQLQGLMVKGREELF